MLVVNLSLMERVTPLQYHTGAAVRRATLIAVEKGATVKTGLGGGGGMSIVMLRRRLAFAILLRGMYA